MPPTLQQISQPHSTFYESLYQQVNPSGTGTVGAVDAAKFLKRSGLPEGILHKIWELSDQGSKGYLDKQGFFIALKLISLAQNGSDVSLQNLSMPTLPPNMGLSPRANTSQSNATTEATNWSITAKKKLQYDSLFDSLKPFQGLLSGEKVKPVLMNSKLPVDTLGKIWDFSDIDKDGSLDRDEFSIAMHLVYSCLEGETLPSSLPAPLIPPSKRGAFPAMSSAPSSVAGVSVAFSSNVDNSFSNAFVPEKSKSSDWVVNDTDKLKYDQMFLKLDLDNDGLVTGHEIREVLIASGLQQQILAHIWNLCDTKNTGQLNSEQFALAMHFISTKKSGKDLPTQLSPEEIPPSMRSAYDLASIKLESTANDFSAIKELDKISTEIDSLGREKVNLQMEIKETEEAIRKRNTEIEDLQNELEKANKGIDQLTKQKQEAQTQLEDLNVQHEKIDKELQDIKSKCQDETAMINQLKSKLSVQSSSIREQEEQLWKARSELEKLRKEENDLEDKYEKESKELESLRSKINQTKDEGKQVQIKIDKLNTDNAELKDELAQLTSTINSVTNSNNNSASFNELKNLNDTFEARFKLQDDQTSARATAGSSPVSSISGFSVGSGRVDDVNDDDFKDNDPFKSKTDPFANNDQEIGDPFNSDDPFKSDPFKSVSFAEDPFAGDPFQQDPFKSDPFKVTSSNNPADNGQSSITDPFRSLNAYMTNQPSASQKSTSVSNMGGDPFLPDVSGEPGKAKSQAITPSDDLFSGDPFASKDPFSSNNDPFQDNTSIASNNDPFSMSANVTSSNTDVFSSTNATSQDNLFTNDPFASSASSTVKSDTFKNNDPFASTTTNTSDSFNRSDPFTTTVTSKSNADPFSDGSDPFSDNTDGGSSATVAKDDPWFAFTENSFGSSNLVKKSNSTEKKESSKQIGGVSEDQQLEWAKRESEREENERKKREQKLREQEEMEIALALKQSVESSSDA